VPIRHDAQQLGMMLTLLHTYLCLQLAEYGIPAEELGFRPLVTNTSAGPAGLVVGS